MLVIVVTQKKDKYIIYCMTTSCYMVFRNTEKTVYVF